MRAVVQRVTEASVRVGDPDNYQESDQESDNVVGAIGAGLCVLVGVTHGDTEEVAEWLAAKLWNLRIFADDDGVMNRSAAEVGAELLVVSQFTLYGDASAGRRPSWTAAAPSAHAEPLVEHLVTTLRNLGATVATGRFGAAMRVALVNDGPVTVLVERAPR